MDRAPGVLGDFIRSARSPNCYRPHTRVRGRLVRINAANHFSQELPRPGLRAESAVGRDRFFARARAQWAEEYPSGRSQPIALNATSKPHATPTAARWLS